MKYLTAIMLGLPLFLSLGACAEHNNGSDATSLKQTAYKAAANGGSENYESGNNNVVPTIIEESGDIFVNITNNSGEVEANYFAMQPSSPEQLATKIIWMLKQVEASKDIIEFANARLAKNRRLKKDDFTLSLTGKDGSQYQFIYTSNMEQRFYSINYKKL